MNEQHAIYCVDILNGHSLHRKCNRIDIVVVVFLTITFKYSDAELIAPSATKYTCLLVAEFPKTIGIQSISEEKITLIDYK